MRLGGQTRGTLVAEAAAALSAAGFEQPRRHARRLVAAALAISQAELFGRPEVAVAGPQLCRTRLMLNRLVAREPLSRILGWRDFWGLEFRLSADTLDPRPETETVVEAVVRRKADRAAPLRLLDLGTGSGCLLLALLSEYPEAGGVGIDIAPGAIATAAVNASALGLADRSLFCIGDWGTALSARFDVVVTNPPYITSGDMRLLPREVAWHDPWRALDGGEDGFAAYRAIAPDAARLLDSGGFLVAEVGVGQSDAVIAIMRAAGLVADGVEKDLAGTARCVILRSPALS